MPRGVLWGTALYWAALSQIQRCAGTHSLLALAPLFATHVCSLWADAAQRGLQFTSARPTFDRLCKGNTYATSLHAINSAIIKLSKLTSAGKVYRGVSGGLLPEACRKPNAHGVKGGVEGGFLSTTFDRSTALFYAKGGADRSRRGGPAIVFETQMGMVDRGAEYVPRHAVPDGPWRLRHA